MENLFCRCDLCGAEDPRVVLESRRLDGPLVKCERCGLNYVGRRRSGLAFGSQAAEAATAKIRAANSGFRHLRLEEEHRLALLNAKWRLELIRRVKPSGKLLEAGCARGDFLQVARTHFDSYGVEPNRELAAISSQIAPVFQDTIERVPWSAFDIIASFHVIEHVDSPLSFVRAAAERLKPGGLLVIETPNIDSLPYKLFGGCWRQFIPEHYFFFNPKTMARLLSECRLKTQRVMRIGKYASIDFIANRLSRYLPGMPHTNFPRLTFRLNPLDIMLVFAMKDD
jgi:2-polyprenyl-3-methyl-5-hydroxy-6-metoxy-1,4-benzoquinol methylase